MLLKRQTGSVLIVPYAVRTRKKMPLFYSLVDRVRLCLFPDPGLYYANPFSYWNVFTCSLYIPRENFDFWKSIWRFQLQYGGSFSIPILSTTVLFLGRWGPLGKSRVSTEHCFKQKHGELIRWCFNHKNIFILFFRSTSDTMHFDRQMFTEA